MYSLCSSALLVGVATAALLHGRDDQGFAAVAPTAPWVRVDDEGQPATTLTPRLSTLPDGSSSVIDAAPHDLTASVYTWTTWGIASTSTGIPPNPTATNTRTNEGAFSRCANSHAAFAPFCRPLHNSTLLTGNTYYVTWDPDYFNGSATEPKTPSNFTYEVALRIDYLNQTSKEMVKLETYDRVPNAWGFWPWHLEKSHLKHYSLNNITMTLLLYTRGSSEVQNRSVALPLSLAAPGLDNTGPSKVPQGTTLAIALPLSLAAFALILVGLCLWNRKTRRIQLGNVMSRSRFHRSGRNGRRRRILRAVAADADAKNLHDIQLDSAPLSTTSSTPSYRDAVPADDEVTLGSLANSPVQENFEQQGSTAAHHNAFRDELRRQDANKSQDKP
ncbi:hypothetical protein CDD81_4453 [Ophiocordyceps australis]|uniref:Mid2 domain-containing protein n=1 Tax=Ophiocordyceps australis TaxID=1399860 RepID=A0A2C5XMM0_9HYPO|nr:hypothetical protein CDD81_4453 [Ophiocordyceps australis]